MNINSGFSFGNIQTKGSLVPAPMDGISDFPFRWICKKMGAGLIFSEFINVNDVPRSLNDLARRASFSNFERPFGYQLYGSEAKSMLKAAMILSENQPDFFDINLGCSDRRVANRGAGAGLLNDPILIGEIISTLVHSIDLPITAKIRLGWSKETLNFDEVAHIIEDSGGKMITVHARTRDQNWNDTVDWNAIKIIKDRVGIPVIGNGNVQSQSDIEDLVSQTGCDGVMIGRAAIGNPWIFSGLEKSTLSQSEIIDVVKAHWFLMIAFYGQERAAYLFKKHLKRYLSCEQFAHINLNNLISSPNSMKDRLFYEQVI